MVAVRVLAAHRAAVVVFVPAVIVVAVAVGVRRVRRGGEPVRVVVLRRRERARARLGSAAQLRAEAPAAAGIAAMASFFAVILALVATGSPGARGVHLPPAADARWQLWGIAIAVAVAVAALDCWFGAGTCVRAVAGDGVTAAITGMSVGLAVLSPLMVLWQTGSRPAWLGVVAAQVVWPFAGGIAGVAVSGRRKRRLFWVAGSGMGADRDLVLVSPGNRKVPVIMAVRTLTGMGRKEAMDLVDNAPGLVMHQVTSEQADSARELLESLGATVTVNPDPGQA
jgi:ribosomal protein L7/L12